MSFFFSVCSKRKKNASTTSSTEIDKEKSCNFIVDFCFEQFIIINAPWTARAQNERHYTVFVIVLLSKIKVLFAFAKTSDGKCREKRRQRRRQGNKHKLHNWCALAQMLIWPIIFTNKRLKHLKCEHSFPFRTSAAFEIVLLLFRFSHRDKNIHSHRYTYSIGALLCEALR